MRRDCDKYFETSDYPPNNQYGIPQVNKKVLEMMKDEDGGIPMTGFVGLRSKQYTTKALSTTTKIEKERAMLQKAGFDDYQINEILNSYGVMKNSKGVKSNKVKTKITFDECLVNAKIMHVSRNLIHSEKHQLYSVSQEKVAFCPHDDKRYPIPDSYGTLPRWHYSIMGVN